MSEYGRLTLLAFGQYEPGGDINRQFYAPRLLSKSLPESLGRLAALEELGIRSNENLVQLPETLGECTALKRLSLPFCERLKSLPQTLSQCVALQYLALDMNTSLASLPDLSGLRYLNVSSNKSWDDPGFVHLKEWVDNGCKATTVDPTSLNQQLKERERIMEDRRQQARERQVMEHRRLTSGR